jgi:hypothetical protein
LKNIKYLLIIIILFIAITSARAFDIGIINIYRDSICKIHVKVKNKSTEKIPERIISNIKIKIHGNVNCKHKKTWFYEKFIHLNNFFVLPQYQAILNTNLRINTKGNCKSNLNAEIYYMNNQLDDDDLTNNVFSKNITGPCTY